MISTSQGGATALRRVARASFSCAALEALATCAGRYAPAARQAGLSFPSTVTLDVAERVPGGPATAFAAPECRRPFPQVTAEAERAMVTPAAARRPAGLLSAAASPAELRKGPRGGARDRDRDKVIGHVIAAEIAYARKLGVRRKQPALGDTAAIEQLRTSTSGSLHFAVDKPLPKALVNKLLAVRMAQAFGEP